MRLLKRIIKVNAGYIALILFTSSWFTIASYKSVTTPGEYVGAILLALLELLLCIGAAGAVLAAALLLYDGIQDNRKAIAAFFSYSNNKQAIVDYWRKLKGEL